MTRPDWIDELRSGLRTVDPDPVLLAQLVELSRGSASPAPRPGRSVGARLAIVLGGAIAVGATSWAAGALPGTDSPFRPEERITHQPTDPTPGDVATPQRDDSRSPAGERTSPPAGEGKSAPPAVPDKGSPSSGPGSGSTDTPGERGNRPSDPPGLTRAPELPDLPPLPDVPPVPQPTGLDRVPDGVPVDPAELQGNGRERAPGLDRDTGASRSPLPREAQVAQEK
ncbi:hypothetical protein [Nocardioides sp. SYSU DS0651]|uniref:hypothetical protein n=1 Tax=Nocardioides sp. SYSU DS0651 TaxID=3415955 RepID=UPI003F4B960D